MTTTYVDHGAYAAYAATPTWATPQDGDGSATTASPTSSTVAVVFTANATAASSSVTVCGVVFSAISGANSGLNFQVGASLSATLDNLVTQINACTTAVGAGVADNGTPQLRNLVFARKAGTDTLEVMSRHGSTRCNGATNTNWKATAANWTSSTTLPASFAGGVGGCWGYLFNHSATIWASAVAIGGYGVWAAALPYMGAVNAGDVVKVRSGKTLTLLTNTNVTWTMAAMGSAGSPVRFDIDDSSVWSDGADPVLKITEAHTSNTLKTWGHLVTTFAHINAKQYNSGQRNLVVESTGNGPSIPVTAINYGGPVRFDNLDIYCPGTPTASPGPQASCMAQFLGAVAGTSGASTVFKNCRIVQPGQAPPSYQYGVVYQTLNGVTKVEFINCEFLLTAASSAWANTTYPFGSGGSIVRVLFDSCLFNGFVSGSRLVTSSATAGVTGQGVIARNCYFGGITVLGPTFMGAGNSDTDLGLTGLYAASQYGNREFVIDRAGKMYVEWVQAKGRPTLSAKLHDGVTPWSIYATTTATAANIGRHSPAELPRIGKAIPASNLLTEAARTFRLNFLLESNLSWTKQDISLLIDYIGTDDVPRTLDTYDAAAGALSTDATSAWSATSWNGQTWNPKYFSVTTPVAVKAGTEVGIYVRIHTTCSADTRGVIIDPEVVIT